MIQLPVPSGFVWPPVCRSLFLSFPPIFNLFSRRFSTKKRLITMRQIFFAWLALIAAVFRCVRCFSVGFSVARMHLNGQGCNMLL